METGAQAQRTESPHPGIRDMHAAAHSSESTNPLATDGFEFVEYTAPDTAELGRLFETMGFRRIARHRSKDVSLYRQGDINFIVNAEPTALPNNSHATTARAPAPWHFGSRMRPTRCAPPARPVQGKSKGRL